MLRRWTTVTAIPLVLLFGASAGSRTSATHTPRCSSPIAVTADGGRIVVANPDSGTISILDAITHAVDEVPVGTEPRSVAIAPDLTRAFVVLRGEGAVVAVDLAGLEPNVRAPVGLDPFAIVAGAARLYVSVGGEGRIAILDPETLEQTASVATEPRPRGLALSSDESTLYVTHFLSGRVSVIDTTTLEVTRVIATGADSSLSESILLDEVRSIAWVPQTRANAGNPALLFDTTLFPIVSAIDLTTRTNDNRKRISLDIADRPVNMPTSAVLASNGILWVANAGSDDVSAIDLTTGHAVAHLETGSNPRGIAISPDQSRIYVSNVLSGTISEIDAASRSVIDEVQVTTVPLAPNILRGKVLFHSSSLTSLARDQWISCASCHPDGGHDGRSWFFRDGLRNTPTLAGVAETAPFHWSGDLDELEDVESTVRIVQAGTGLASGGAHCEPACDEAPPNRMRSADLDALGDFMRSLRTRQRSPHLKPDGTLDRPAMRGQAIFFSAMTGCASCHPPPLFTDRSNHDVGTGRGASERKGTSFDTPSLRFLFSSAPYLHDGSAPSLRDVVTTGNPGDLHGRTSHLSSAELDDLVAFLESIPFATARRRAVRSAP